MNEQPPPRAYVGPAAGDTSPHIQLEPLIRCGAGTSATFEVFITHRGPVAAYLRVTVLGLDSRWVPPPLPVGPIEPGETTRITLSLVPERGALGAKYPFVVAAEATPISGKSAPTMGVAESVLAVDGRDPITMTVSPQTPTAVFGRRIKVQITNPGHFDRELTLTGSAARGAAISLSSTMVTIPAGRTITVPGRVRVTHPHIVGGQNTHTFSVGARGFGAPEFADGTLRSKPLMGGRLTGLLVAVVVIALWAGSAVVGIPKLSKYFSGKSADSAATAPIAPGAANAAGASGNAVQSASGSAPNAAGGAAAGGAAAGGAAAGGAGGEASGARLSGTVTGIAPKGVSVSLEPSSLVEAAAAGALPAAGATDASTASALRAVSTGMYKIPEDALRLAPAASDSGLRATTSATDGTFSFAGISAPGYYLLTLAKAGFATQRFMINAATLAAATPIKVGLVPGDGSMSGQVTSLSGAVGAASVSITDGTVALQTSTSSKTGNWTVKGLSTPGTYLVTVTSTGFGASSTLIKLAAGGTGTANLALIPGVAAIDGTVSGTDGLGHLGGIGGVTVTATGTSKGVAATRTATTVTSGPVGSYALPDLPVPGRYTVTVSGAGFASQTEQVTLTQGSSSAIVNISLTWADGIVAGTVSGGGSEGGLIGAGLTLTGTNATYKTMTTSVPAGAYRFTGVPPGTYVLQGSQYGRIASSATVVVTAATTATANLTLTGAPDSELPATARITGRAVDSRTQGPLTCDRAAEATSVCLVTASVPIPVPDSKTGATETISATSGPAENYTLPGIDDKTRGGLVPGLYSVTLSAPGYESTAVQVQVAQGQVNPAAQVSLPPLGLITGTITTHVGVTATNSCVIAVPAGVAVPKACTTTSTFTTCKALGAATARCSMTQTNGGYEIRGLRHGGYQVVVVPTDREYVSTTPFAVQLDLGGDFRYDATLDRLGRATVTVLQPNLTSLGLSAAKGAVIGILDAGGIGRGNPLAGDSSGPDGILTITGLLGTYTAVAAGDIPTGLTPATLPAMAAASTGAIGLNQTVAVTEVLTASIGAVVGRVTVTVDGEIRPVVNTYVQVSGIVSFSGRTPISGSATVETDAHGCYAIVPLGWSNLAKPPALISNDCTNVVAAGSTVKNADGTIASLIALPLSISVDAQFDPGTHNPSTQSYSATGVLIGFKGDVSPIPAISLLAQPSTFANLSLNLKAPAGVSLDASNTTFSLVRKAAGSGNITIVAAANGDLTWTDSLVGEGRAVPGTYIVRATKLGFSSATPPDKDTTGMASGYATIYCDLATACRFGTRITPAAAGWPMGMLPTISGTITAPGSQALIGMDKTSVSVVATPPGSGTDSVSVDANGVITFRDSALLAAQVPGLPGGLALPAPASNPYVFTVSLPGYVSKTIQISCDVTYLNSPTSKGCSSFDTTLTPLPLFTGSITAVSSPGTPLQPLTGVNISISAQPNPQSTVVIGIADTSSSTSTLKWIDPTQPVAVTTTPPTVPPIYVVTPGAYVMTFTKNGFASQTVPFTCASPAANSTQSTTCDLGTVQLLMNPEGSGKVHVDQLPPDPNNTQNPVVNWVAATVTVNSAPAGANGLTISVIKDADDSTGRTGNLAWTYTPVQTFTGTTVPGSYTLTVNVPGYGSSTPAVLTCTSGATCGVGPIEVSHLPAYGSTPVHTTSTLDNSVDDWADISATVTQQPIATSAIKVTVSPTSGVITWNDNSEPIGVVYPGAYTVAFSKSGYAPTTAQFTCTANIAGTAATCPTQNVVLNMFPKGIGTVSVPQSSVVTPIDWSTATAVLTTQPANSSGVSFQLTSIASTDPTLPPSSATLGWTDSNLSTSLAGVTAPGTYVLKVSLPGYVPLSTAPFTCAATSAKSTCNPGPIVLQPLPGVSGVVTVTPYTIAEAPGVTLDAAAGTTDGTTVSVDQQPNPNKGVSVTVVSGTPTTTGTVSWNDPTQKLGVAGAGDYALTFRKPGYLAVSVSFHCTGLTTCQIPEADLKMNPVGTGTVSVDLAPSSGPIDWSTAKISVVSLPSGSTAQVTAVGTSATTAHLVWSDPTATYAGLVQPGLYTVSMTLPGYSALGTGSTYAATCVAGQPCGPRLLFTKHAEFSGIVTVQPDATTLTGAVLQVTPPPNAPAVTAQVSATRGATARGFGITWQEAGGAPANLVSNGTYTLTLTAPDYQPTSITWTCTATACLSPALVLSKTSTLQVTVLIAGSTTPVNGGIYALTGTVGGTVATNSTVNAPAGQNTVSFPALPSAADYSVTINEAGFATATFNASSATTAAKCVDSTGLEHPGFAVWPGGNTLCTVYVAQLGTITAHVTGSTNGTSSELGSATVAVVRLVGGTASPPIFTGSTSVTGDLSITGTTAAQGLTSGTWQVTARQPGYADKVGTIDITAGTYAMATPTGGLTLSTGGTPTLGIELSVLPVELQVHLQLNSMDALPPVTVTIAGASTFTCTIVKTSAAGVTPAQYNCGGPMDQGVVASSTYVDFPAVSPGVYTATVSSATAAYQTSHQQIQILLGVPTQYIYIPLDQRTSTQSGTVLLPTSVNTGITSATVTMRATQNIGVIATDSNGNLLSVNPDSKGVYKFSGVPDGYYTVVAEFPGYAPASYPSTITENSSVTKTPTSLAPFSLSVRGTRSVDVTVTSAAAVSAADGSAVNLAGATITLTSTSSVPGFDASAAPPQSMNLPTGTGPYTVNFPQLPTGNWKAAITLQNNAPFPGDFGSQRIAVPDAAVTAGTPPNIAAALQIQQALTNLAVTWNASNISAATSSCLAAPTTSSGTLALTITNTGAPVTNPVTPAPTASVQAIVTTANGVSTALAQIYLPVGSYSFVPTGISPMWTAGSTAFTVGPLAAVGATSAPSTATVALTPVQVPVSANMTVDSLGSNATGLTVTATATGQTTSSANLDAAGAASMCLAPDAGWNFQVTSSSVAQQISVPSQNIAVVAAPTGTQNTVNFTASTVTPAVSLQNVATRNDTTAKDVTVTISYIGPHHATTLVYSKMAGGVMANNAATGTTGTTVTTTPIILGTCSACAYIITATPVVAGVFSAVIGQTLDPSHSATFALTLLYNATMITVTVQRGSVPTSGINVAVAPSGVIAAATATDGTTLFQDVPLAAQTFSATWTDTTVTPNKVYRGSTTTDSTFRAGSNSVLIKMTTS